MTAEDSKPVARNPAAPAAGGRHSTAVLVVAGLVGLVLGAIAAFAITGFVWTIRVELPPPPYPAPLSTPPGYLYPPPPASATAPAPGPGVVPAPPPPPAPHAVPPLPAGG